MPRVQVYYFASLGDLAGCSQEICEVPEEMKTSELKAWLSQERPKLKGSLGACRIAVNHSFVDGDLTIKAGDEVALIPPVSGG